jgi:hypothetical protein
VHDDAGVIEQAFARRRRFDAATAAPEQRNAERLLQPLIRALAEASAR